MLKIAQQPRFFAEESRKILIDWINSVSIDWPISRRRYYATAIRFGIARNARNHIVLRKEKTAKRYIIRHGKKNAL